MNYIELFREFRKANPQFYTAEEPIWGAMSDDGSGPSWYKVFVDKGLVNWRGYEIFYSDDKSNVNPSTYMDENECCKELLLGVMHNKSMQVYFDLTRFDSLEELALKLAVIEK